MISYFYHEEIHLFSHRWAAEFLLDLGFPVQLIAVTCTDPSYAEWDRLVCPNRETYTCTRLHNTAVEPSAELHILAGYSWPFWVQQGIHCQGWQATCPCQPA